MVCPCLRNCFATEHQALNGQGPMSHVCYSGPKSHPLQLEKGLIAKLDQGMDHVNTPEVEGRF
jgi:hypothetical protein